ncbi:deoxynucleoside kinase [Natronogracilivirga saccharolytica]|uniref:Deoxynucleoside kinase n=1 Tax=Natronogracilivirga saccharolytica TaxID=2812953 RepID=A0A8J7S832_9BACT|nr:deoxynucleoside kinase [Natronogracilivirga saccharolytica]MBP3191993.1 deoxynucleoside kinase [Natronogracilivirga saccharolytica]
MNQFDFIAIEGVIGAGKTSLARLLAERHNARLVLEEFEENPFLPKFYEDRERYAFQTQLAFLASRFKQQEVLRNRDLFQEMVISDYLFDKDRIFARLNLSGDEMALYDSIYSIMSSIAAKADLVVFIQSSVDRLMQNISSRGRPYEKEISRNYIEELNNAYNHFFHHYSRSPLIIINASEVDFVQDAAHLKYIEDQIFSEPIRSNTTHITPG